MRYIQGFIVPVPEGNKEAYRKLAIEAAPIFTDYGAERIVECWGDQLSRGEQTDFFRGVDARDGENVVFSWIEWPSKAACEKAATAMMDDERMQEPPEMPFDGKRMVYAGFDMITDKGGHDRPIGYVQGYVAPVPVNNQAKFQAMAEGMAELAMDHGALTAIDAWAADIADGEVTDFKKAVKTQDGEAVVFGFTAWSSKEAHSAGMPKMRQDDRMPDSGSAMPFDGKRLIYGSFDVLMDTAAGA